MALGDDVRVRGARIVESARVLVWPRAISSLWRRTRMRMLSLETRTGSSSRNSMRACLRRVAMLGAASPDGDRRDAYLYGRPAGLAARKSTFVTYSVTHRCVPRTAPTFRRPRPMRQSGPYVGVLVRLALLSCCLLLTMARRDRTRAALRGYCHRRLCRSFPTRPCTG